MPTPAKGESRQKFVSRCIPIVKKENSDLTNEQAAGRCYGIYDNWKKKADSEVADHQRLQDFMDAWEELAKDGTTESDNIKLKELE